MALVSLRQRLDHAAAKNAAREIVEARFEAFGCAGQAARIRPVPLEAMIQRYR